MAFAHLDRDAAVALDAISANDVHRAHVALCHAQDLVAELALMVDQDCWEHAGKLVAIYDYVGQLFMHANVAKDLRKVSEAKALLAELGAAFTAPARTAAADAPSGARLEQEQSSLVPSGFVSRF
jgi:flagellar biosynthetic protein FliS